jgi:hypothetical protein
MKKLNLGQYVFERFFALIVACKLFHYRTKKYSAHKTIDAFFERFISLSDRFLETLQGHLNIHIKFDSLTLDIPIITDEDWKTKLDSEIAFLNDLDDHIDAPDILNIRDEIVGEIKNTKYLLTFN